ncbi:reverse transcriptase domain-containing protein [Tanacetum coccineum]
MMKFPTSNGIATISTTRETLRECRQIEEAQDLSRHARVTDPTPMQRSSEMANPRLSLAPVKTRPRRPGKEPMQLDGTEGRRQLDKGRRLPKSSVEEKIVINDNYPEQLVTIGGGLSAECRHALIHTLRKNVDIFAWTPADMTGIPRSITEHSLDTYPHIEPKAQKKRSLSPDRRKVVTDEVNEWLKPYRNLNKACLKDLYPLPNIDWKIESLMGFPYKCLLDAYKGYHQIHMTKKDEEKTAFHTEEGVFCYTKMPFGLKDMQGNISEVGRLCLQGADRGKPRSCMWTIWNLNPRNVLRCEEGKFLGYVVTSEGIRANPEKAKAVMDMPSPKTLKQMQSLNEEDGTEFQTLTTPDGEDLICTLAAANEAVSAVLLTERNGRQMPIHYVSRSLQGAETNYAPMEKLALALVHAARRLRRYFQAHPIKVITDSPIGQVLNNSGASGRQLSSRHSNSTSKCYSRGGITNPRVEDIPEPSNTRGDLTPGPKAWRLYTDGASNNEGSRAGLILIAPDDSLELAGAFNKFRITHIPRAENRKADALSKLAAVQFDHLSKEVLVEVLNERSIEAQEVNVVVEEEGPTWMTPIRDYLEKGKLPEDPVNARTLMEKIGNYKIEDGVLYRKSYLVPLMRCVGPLQANYVIREVHMGSCGMHDGPRQVVAKAMNLGYFWPSMHRDARELIRVCDDCQAHAAVPRLPKADMISVTSAWPFMKWGMDIVGPFPEGPGRGLRIPATIVTDNGTQFVNDPFKKWAESSLTN